MAHRGGYFGESQLDHALPGRLSTRDDGLDVAADDFCCVGLFWWSAFLDAAHSPGELVRAALSLLWRDQRYVRFACAMAGMERLARLAAHGCGLLGDA